MIKKNPGWTVMASFQNNSNKNHDIFINPTNLSLDGAICSSLTKTLEHLQNKNKNLTIQNAELFRAKCQHEGIQTDQFSSILIFPQIK